MSHVKSVMHARARMARAIAGTELSLRPRRELTSEEKKLARHAAHEGKTLAEIAKVLNWDLHLNTLCNKLKALNIKTFKMYNNSLRRK